MPLELESRSSGTRNGKKTTFDLQTFLYSAGVARTIKNFRKNEIIYSNGDAARNVLFIQKGGVKITVVNESGREAIVAILGPGEFLGESCISNGSARIRTATAISSTTVLVIEKAEMRRALRQEHAFSDCFITCMLERNIRAEEDLVDQLFDSRERHLARTLLVLAGYGKRDQPERVIPRKSQKKLAEMIGTTRVRVNEIMHKFRRLGFIEYNDGLQINNSLLTFVLQA